MIKNHVWLIALTLVAAVVSGSAVADPETTRKSESSPDLHTTTQGAIGTTKTEPEPSLSDARVWVDAGAISMAGSEEVVASKLTFLHRIKAVSEQLGLGPKRAARVRIMAVYNVDELEPLQRARLIAYLLEAKDRGEFPIIMIGLSSTDVTKDGDFVGTPIAIRLASEVALDQKPTQYEKIKHANLVLTALREYSTSDKSWDRFVHAGQETLMHAVTKKLRPKIMHEPLLIAAETKIEGLLPWATAVFYDFDIYEEDVEPIPE